MKSFKEYLLEKELSKNKWELLINPADKEEHSKDLIQIVGQAYKHTTLGSFVKSSSDVASSEWMVMDYDENPDIDIAIFYRKPRANEKWVGFKIQGIGHDGTKESKTKLLNKVAGLLQGKNFWIEASDSMAASLEKRNVRKETNADILKTVFPSIKKINADGSYIREISGKEHHEVVFGKLK